MPFKDKEKRRLTQRKYQATWYKKNKAQHIKAVRRSGYIRGKKHKLELIKLFGGKCIKCGYNEHWSVFDFHHKKGKKEKNIGSMLKVYSWKKILKEVKKCDLVCKNCHAILHYNLWHKNDK